MEKRRSVKLWSLLARYLVFTGALLLACVAIWWSGLTVLFRLGVVYTAGTGETMARESMQAMRQRGSFREDLVPELCDYVYFDASGEVVSTSMDADLLERAEARYQSDVGATGWGKVEFDDKSTCMLHWGYQAQFVDAGLRDALPPFEYLWLVVLILPMAVCVFLRTRSLSRRLSCRLDMMTEVSRKIGARELDFEAPCTGVREFDNVMDAMDEMRVALKEALQARWSSEQQRARQTQALVHDMKTPLTIIGGNAEMLAEEPLTPGQKEMVGYIRSSAARAQAYVAALHQAAGGEEKEEPAQMLDAEELLAQVAAQTKPLAAAKECILQVENNGPVQLRALPAALQRALVNILENAVRYSPKAGRVTLRMQSGSDGAAVFTVRDQGPGFSPEALARATEPFWQQEAARSEGGHHGLGLAIAAETARRHGGTLRLANAPEGGALVTLSLPQ